METLLQHLPLVADISGDGLERHAEVQSPVLDVAADPVQLGVGEFIFGVLLQETKVLLRDSASVIQFCTLTEGFLEIFLLVCHFTGNETEWKLVFCFKALNVYGREFFSRRTNSL